VYLGFAAGMASLYVPCARGSNDRAQADTSVAKYAQPIGSFLVGVTTSVVTEVFVIQWALVFFLLGSFESIPRTKNNNNSNMKTKQNGI
jgi:hypothetical protein